MNKKGAGRKSEAASRARMLELLGMLNNLGVQYPAHQSYYEELRNLIRQALNKEPAFRTLEKDIARAAAVDRAHAAGHKLTLGRGGAFSVASKDKDVVNTDAKGSASTMKNAHQRIKRDFAQGLAELEELTTPQS